MIYNRPGRGVYVTNGEAGTINHGDPAYVDEWMGIAVKQKARDWDEALSVAAVIDKKEDFFLVTKGVVEVDMLEGAKAGKLVYFDEKGEKLTLTAEKAKGVFGKVTEIEGERGTAKGSMRVDLDSKA